MHFGRTLLAQQYEPWTSNYLDYNRLKAVLERIDDDDDQPANYKFLSESTRCLELVATSLSFTSLFDEQVETVVYFFLQRQGDIALRLCQLRSEQRQLFCEDLAEQWIDLHKRLHDTALELLHLIRFVDLNCTAIRKILKKHDRITGRRLSESYRSTHYSVLSPLFEHGGLEALSKILEDTFDELYLMHQQMQPRSNLFRSASTPTEETESVLSISSLPSKKQHQSLRYNRDEMYKDYKTIMVEIEQAKHQLKQTKGFMHMLAAPMLLGSTDEDSVSLHIKDDLDQERRISNWLNFMSTFLHLTDYYIVGMNNFHVSTLNKRIITN
jgi:SPX domain protein involved in polyphosphate accumulation